MKCLQIPRSSYYFKEKGNTMVRGISKSIFTKKAGGQWIHNDQVVNEIKEMLNQEFIDDGYLKTMHWLRKVKGYLINKKKVYRLMKENVLLNSVSNCTRASEKTWVKELIPQPSQSLEYFEMDIKYIHIHKLRRNALLLSVIDVESRWVLGQTLAWRIQQNEVSNLFDEIFSKYDLPKRIYIRNDNGSQFSGQSIQNYFKKLSIIQEFTKPATPEQNAHIESYHSILERVICKRYQFDTIQEARETLNRFVKFYNRDRIHSGIDYQSPYEYLKSKKILMDYVLESETMLA
ncbi:MAG: integrase core domain-containing protein [Saprospiraceae bacterium]